MMQWEGNIIVITTNTFLWKAVNCSYGWKSAVQGLSIQDIQYELPHNKSHLVLLNIPAQPSSATDFLSPKVIMERVAANASYFN